MNQFAHILAASPGQLLELFELSAIDVGTEGRNVEKDFYVNLVLDLIYNHKTDGIPINFKGGTSLSLGHGLIARFSEDVDFTVSRSAIGALPDSAVREAKAISGRKHSAALKEISAVCGRYVSGPFKSFLDESLQRLQIEAKRPAHFSIDIDPADEYGQNLMINYKSVYPVPDDPYVLPRVKLEGGARGSLQPASLRTVEPYVNRFLPKNKIKVPNVETLDPVRTFFEKLTAVHSFRQTMATKEVPDRLSRHYYDLHSMWTNPAMRARIEANWDMLDTVREYKLLLFYRKNENLELAVPGTLTAQPDDAMRKSLQVDYARMSTMVFGLPPTFEAVVESVAEIEREVNEHLALTL